MEKSGVTSAALGSGYVVFFVYSALLGVLADPVSPPGLALSGIYGQSSNQELYLGSGSVSLLPDDFVFFRPRQSEAVFLQFCDIAVYNAEKGVIEANWPVFPVSA